MQDFRKLRVWEASHGLTLSIYEATRPFPRDERYGLTAQLRRAAVSVPMNIAEACGRNTARDTANFFQMAMGSACEMEYGLLLCSSLGFLPAERYRELDAALRSVKRMLARLIARTRHPAGRKPTTDNR